VFMHTSEMKGSVSILLDEKRGKQE
jgi:hypothetical protein